MANLPPKHSQKEIKKFYLHFFFHFVVMVYTNYYVCPIHIPFAHLPSTSSPLPSGCHRTVECVCELCTYFIGKSLQPSFQQRNFFLNGENIEFTLTGRTLWKSAYCIRLDVFSLSNISVNVEPSWVNYLFSSYVYQLEKADNIDGKKEDKKKVKPFQNTLLLGSFFQNNVSLKTTDNV